MAQKAVVSDIKFTDAPAKKTTEGDSIRDVRVIVVLFPYCPLLYPAAAVYLDVIHIYDAPVDDSGDDDGRETLYSFLEIRQLMSLYAPALRFYA